MAARSDLRISGGIAEEVISMYGYIAGYSDTEDIDYCPKCGAEIREYWGDGTAVCSECGFHFGVVEAED